MRRFNVLRYLKRFIWLIIVVATVGAISVFTYALQKQTYTASMVIRYTGGEIPEDMREIYSANIIDAALVELDIDADIDKVRSNFRVEPVIPEDDRTMIEALLEKGEEPEYVPDTYRIIYVDTNRELARNILDAVMKNYYESYTEKFTEEQLPENRVSHLAGSGNDYLESAEVIEEALANMLTFLDRKQEAQSNLRSIHTGCSYQDLYEDFESIYRHELPALYVEIISTGAARDGIVVRTTLVKEIEDMEQHLGHLSQEIDLLEILMKNYTEQARSVETFHQNAGDGSSSDITLDEIQEVYYSNKNTTYDDLIDRYVELRTDYDCTLIDMEHKQFLLDAFGGVVTDMEVATPDDPSMIRDAIRENTAEETVTTEVPSVEIEAEPVVEPDGETAAPEAAVTEAEAADVPEENADEPAAETVPADTAAEAAETEGTDALENALLVASSPSEKIENHINNIVTVYNEYYDVANETCRELNGVLSAQYLTTVSSISAQASIRLGRYVLISLFLFLILGVALSIFLGRGLELVEGMLYVDRTVDLPNRARCDLFIEENSTKLLPEGYCCIVWNLQLNRISERFGRHAGDEVLRDYAQILKSFMDVYGFVAHNGGGQFFGFFENFSRKRLDAIMQTMRSEADRYNQAKGNEIMIYSTGSAITSEDGEYQLRPLLRMAVQRQLHGVTAKTDEQAAK